MKNSKGIEIVTGRSYKVVHAGLKGRWMLESVQGGIATLYPDKHTGVEGTAEQKVSVENLRR